MTRNRHHRRLAMLNVLLLSGSCLLMPSRVIAQAWNYPSLQLPTVSTRDYTAAMVTSEGTSALFQWREGVGDGMHLGLDVGIADPHRVNSSLLLFVGGTLGREMLRATKDQPLDLLFTGGIGLAVGGHTSLERIPIGISIGHRFRLQDDVAFTPYVHPRLSLDVCSSCSRRGNHNSRLSLNVDLGMNFDVNSRFAVRVGWALSDSDLLGTEDAFAVGVNWTPAPIRRK